MRVTTRDPSLPHQVQLLAIGTTIYVSCNCRTSVLSRGWHGQYDSRDGPGPIGVTSDRHTTKRLYNDPKNHVGPVPFTEDMHIHFSDLEGHNNGLSSQGV